MVESDTFCEPFLQKAIQNQLTSMIIALRLRQKLGMILSSEQSGLKNWSYHKTKQKMLSKGQLISKSPIGVFKSLKKTRISALASKKRSNQKSNVK